MSILSFDTPARLNAKSPWMAAPDIIAFSRDDPPIIPGNIETGTFSGNAYGTWFQRTNPVSGVLEWCMPIGINRTEVRYSDKPNPLGYLDKMALRNIANYTVSGATKQAVYCRDESIGQGETHSPGSEYMLTQRHTIYIKLAAVPTNGDVITISNSAPKTFLPFTFTYNDKMIRASGIQVNMVGQRPNDTLRYGYLAMRIPGGANQGTVDFINTYGKTSFQILNSAKATVYTGSIVQRCSSAKAVGEGYDNGIDVADMSHGFSVTGISKATTALVTCAGHDFVVNDRVRFAGINGMTEICDFELIPPGGEGYWIGLKVIAPVTAGVSFTIDLNTTGYTTFANTTNFATALGGINNKVFKCFNTNRAGTFVFGLDFSGWTPSTSGTHYIYIPGYGISDPFLIQSNAWAIAAGKSHQGLFNLRLGCAVNSTNGYSRGVAVADGVNGCTNYQSKLVATFCSEGGSAYYPAGGTIATAGMGAYADHGTLTLSSMTCPAGTVLATTTVPHGIPNGTDFAIQPIGFTPTLYNTVQGGNFTAGIARSTGTNTFTWDMGGQVLAAADVSVGKVLTGFVTSTRTGTKAAVQDAGDNDDLAVDHFPGYHLLALAFRNIPQASRVTPYTVPLSTTLLNPTLFAGTDDKPPLFHELFWYADQYRQGQLGSGAVWGGTGYGKFESQVADYPETIDKYHGTNAYGSLTGQTVMAFAYAPDHLTTMMYAGLAAQLAQIAYDYGLTTLGDTYKASAIAAYAWADSLMNNVTTRNTYYNGTLNLQAKMGWTTTQYNQAVQVLTDRALPEKFHAAASLYRLLNGPVSGQAYGDTLEKKTLSIFDPLSSVAFGGSGYAVNDFITITATGSTGVDINAVVMVTAVSGGVITAARQVTIGQYTTTKANPIGQGSTTGSGTGATFNFSSLPFWQLYLGATRGCVEYAATPGCNATIKAAMVLPANYDNGNPAINLNSAMGYMGMYFDVVPVPARIGMMDLASPEKAITAHMLYVLANTAAAPGARSSNYLKMMQAGASAQIGANFANKSFQTGTGFRSFTATLHEDAFKYGAPTPDGIIAFGYQGYAKARMFNNFRGIGDVGGDGTLLMNSDNTSGLYEGAATPGSAKMWNPWRLGSSFWEWQPENRLIIYTSEFGLMVQCNTISTQLYLHGWDGNT